MFAGIIVGLLTAWLFDRYHTIELPSYLGFFGGRRFVPIAVSLACLFIAFAMSYFYPIFDAGLTGLGKFIGGSGALGAFVYGFANRMLIPVGLHHIVNSYVWFLYGDYQKPDGTVVTGELTRFAAGDPTAGILTSGFFPILMFGLPAAALAMIHVANKKQKKLALGILSAAGLTAFLTGVTEPLEFSFMFVAFPLYIIHALLTGLSLAIAYLLDIHLGFSFSAGLIDLLLYGTAPAAKNIPLLIGMGVVFFALYYFMFRFAIMKWNMRTPGREPEDEFEAEQRANLTDGATPPPRPSPSVAPPRSPRRRRRQQGRAADRGLRRPGEPRQRRRLHHAAAHGGCRQDQGRSGPAQSPRRGGRPGDREQRPGGLRHAIRSAQERHQRRPLRSRTERSGSRLPSATYARVTDLGKHPADRLASSSPQAGLRATASTADRRYARKRLRVATTRRPPGTPC